MRDQPIFTIQALVIWSVILGSVVVYHFVGGSEERPLTAEIGALQRGS